MPTTTANLGLAKPLESENWDPNVYNNNFDKIDKLTHIVESGTTTSKRWTINGTSSNGGTITWHYKKYSDGSLEAQTMWKIANWLCNDSQGQDGTWRSGWIHVEYPTLGQKSIFYKNAYCASSSTSSDSTQCWVMDSSDYGEDATYQTIELVATREETNSAIEKVIYMEFKGMWK